jgi:hypothetical protein
MCRPSFALLMSERVTFWARVGEKVASVPCSMVSRMWSVLLVRS